MDVVPVSLPKRQHLHHFSSCTAVRKSVFTDVGHATGAPAEASAEQGVDQGDAGKRARALQKKLRQVQQLKEKAAQGPLEPEQMQKIEGEQALIDELKSLGV